MDSEKPKLNWQRIAITAGIVIFAALVVGGTTWYLMDKSEKEVDAANKAQTEELQTKISKLEAAAKKETPPPPPPAATSLSTLEEYCKTSNNGILIPSYSYMKNTDGEYANCYVGGETGGAFLIAKFKAGAWTKLWAGNGVIDVSVCDADKIPNKMSGGTCNY